MTEPDNEADNEQLGDHLFISYATEDGDLAKWLIPILGTKPDALIFSILSRTFKGEL